MPVNQSNLFAQNEIPDIPLLDQAALEQIMSIDTGNNNLAKEMFDIFETDMPTRISALQAAIASNDLAGITEVSHAMRGSCGTIGAMRLGAISTNMEGHGRGFEVGLPPQKMFEILQTTYDDTRRALKNYLKKNTY